MIGLHLSDLHWIDVLPIALKSISSESWARGEIMVIEILFFIRKALEFFMILQKIAKDSLRIAPSFSRFPNHSRSIGSFVDTFLCEGRQA